MLKRKIEENNHYLSNKKTKNNENLFHLLCKKDGLNKNVIDVHLTENFGLGAVNDFDYGYVHLIAEHQNKAFELIEHLAKKGVVISQIACTPIGNKTILDCYMKNNNFSPDTFKKLLVLFVKEKGIGSLRDLRKYFNFKSIESFVFNEKIQVKMLKEVFECVNNLFPENNDTILTDEELKTLIHNYINECTIEKNTIRDLVTEIRRVSPTFDFVALLLHRFITKKGLLFSRHTNDTFDMLLSLLDFQVNSRKFHRDFQFLLHKITKECFSNHLKTPFFLRLLHSGVTLFQTFLNEKQLLPPISKRCIPYFLADQHFFFDFPLIQCEYLTRSRQESKTFWSTSFFRYYSIQVQERVTTFLTVLSILFPKKKPQKHVSYIPKPLLNIIFSYLVAIPDLPTINIYTNLNNV